MEDITAYGNYMALVKIIIMNDYNVNMGSVGAVGPNRELWYSFVSWCGEETVRMEVPSKQKTLFQAIDPTSWIRKTCFKELATSNSSQARSFSNSSRARSFVLLSPMPN